MFENGNYVTRRERRTEKERERERERALHLKNLNIPRYRGKFSAFLTIFKDYTNVTLDKALKTFHCTILKSFKFIVTSERIFFSFPLLKLPISRKALE